MSEDKEKAIQEVLGALEVQSLKSSFTRGRSITCGTCFNGMVEVLIRGDGDKILWVVMTPGETGELIHALAATIGCTVNIEPRTDILSFRDWKINNKERQLDD